MDIVSQRSSPRFKADGHLERRTRKRLEIYKDVILDWAFALGMVLTGLIATIWITIKTVPYASDSVWAIYAFLFAVSVGGLLAYFPGAIVGEIFSALIEAGLSLLKAIYGFKRIHVQFVEDEIRSSLRYAPSIRRLRRRVRIVS
ncbi:MAG: hypothetical protein JST84_18175 [Acidobacteria bacterium]|nr:hypothetical protein [Acidobacteriota bacterium]